MATAKTIKTVQAVPVEDTLFAAPIYTTRKTRSDRTRNLILGGVAVAVMAALAGGLMIGSGADDEVASLTPPPGQGLVIQPVPAVPLAAEAANPPVLPVTAPSTPARAAVRVARAPANTIEQAPSASSSAADVSASVPDPAPAAPPTESLPPPPAEIVPQDPAA